MSEQIIIPTLGESITEATIVKLFKKAGDIVTIDEIILELETEKVNIEVAAKTSGVIQALTKKEGDNVLVGEVIGNITSQNIPATISQTISQPPIIASTASQINSNPTTKPDTNLPAKNNDEKPSTSQNTPQFSPAVNKLLTEHNLDPKDIAGSGKRGMLTKGDILDKLNAPEIVINSPIITGNNQVESSNEGRKEERVKMSRLRQTIAKRLKDSQNTAAILTTFNEINMSKVMALRQTYKEIFEKKYNTKLGFMSFFVKAVVDALQLIPAVNAEIQGDDLIYKSYYDIGVAVGGPSGLVVPIIRNCENLNFAQIEMEIINYSNKAKTGKLSMNDLTGGTFTISNGGVYGSLLSTPIINPPQSGILGLHKIEERPIVINNKVEIQPMMYVALSYDHRVIDGKDAVTFLVKVKENIENPERLLLNV